VYLPDPGAERTRSNLCFGLVPESTRILSEYRPLKPRMLMAQVLASIRAALTPGAIRSAPGMLAARHFALNVCL
jgi:hypothetical protein